MIDKTFAATDEQIAAARLRLTLDEKTARKSPAVIRQIADEGEYTIQVDESADGPTAQVADVAAGKTVGENELQELGIAPGDDNIVVRLGAVRPENVAEVDPSVHAVSLDVNVGDVVIFSKYGGTEVRYRGDDYLILSSRDVLGVVPADE